MEFCVVICVPAIIFQCCFELFSHSNMKRYIRQYCKYSKNFMTNVFVSKERERKRVRQCLCFRFFVSVCVNVAVIGFALSTLCQQAIEIFIHFFSTLEVCCTWFEEEVTSWKEHQALKDEILKIWLWYLFGLCIYYVIGIDLLICSSI